MDRLLARTTLVSAGCWVSWENPSECPPVRQPTERDLCFPECRGAKAWKREHQTYATHKQKNVQCQSQTIVGKIMAQNEKRGYIDDE